MSQIAVFSRFVRIVACSRILSELSVIPVCGHRLLCSLSSVGGHLGYFHLLALVLGAAVFEYGWTKCLLEPLLSVLIFFFLRFLIYLFMRDTQREAETQAEKEAGSMQGAWCGTRSWDSRITPWAKGRRWTAEPSRDLPAFNSFVHVPRSGISRAYG